MEKMSTKHGSKPRQREAWMLATVGPVQGEGGRPQPSASRGWLPVAGRVYLSLKKMNKVNSEADLVQ